MPSSSTARSDARLVIQGVTLDGKTFRPSDWAQRLAGVAARFGRDRRLRLDPRVTHGVLGGVNVLVIDPRLQQKASETYAFLLQFARSNRLVVRECRAVSSANCATVEVVTA